MASRRAAGVPTVQSQARERAWLRRQMGYQRKRMEQAIALHEQRIAELEALLGRRYYPADD